MVSLKLDVCDDRPKTCSSQPTLVLRDWSQEPFSALPSRRSPLAHLENTLLAAAASAVFGYFLITSAASLLHSVQQSYSSQTLPQTIVISRAVQRGDTLAGLARRYGNPNTYILKREDQIARANHLTGTAPLLPGQHLQIPVTNPAIIAQIIRSSHSPLVASR